MADPRMITVAKEERMLLLDRMLIRDGIALDLGVGGTFDKIYAQRNFSRVEAFNASSETVAVVKTNLAGFARPEWHFFCADARSYVPEEDFDLITATHVVEHLTLEELTVVLDRLVPRCRRQFLIETPEQFDSNLSHVSEENNPFEIHKSLVTGDFLSRWDFVPQFRYQQNVNFSNAVYLRGTPDG